MVWTNYTTISYKTSREYPILLKKFSKDNNIFSIFSSKEVSVSLATKILMSLALVNIDNPIILDSARNFVFNGIDISSGNDFEKLLKNVMLKQNIFGDFNKS